MCPILSAVREGIALVENGLSPYSGDIFHEVSISYSNICIGMCHGLCMGAHPCIHTHAHVLTRCIISLQTPLILVLFRVLYSLGEWAVGGCLL